ncbi:MAG TPA: Fur family transcriptional regulator [Caulobacterales bacterium]|jgi:Fur family iron response transcriptional regulator|nr:Fur family transcriptional regulator [Caulobacterales bacterium]
MTRDRAESAANERVLDMLRGAGLKPTRQRLALGALLFGGEHRHVSCESLFDEARAAGADLSLATVYNTLHQFREAGLVREVHLDAQRRWFDTNVGEHHHFYVEESGALVDIPADSIEIKALPSPPRGFAVEGVDVVVRVRAKPARK